MSDAIKNYWEQLEPRERLVLSWGSVVVALIIFYSFLWQPWHKAIDEMEESIQTMRADLVWVRQHADILANGGKGLEQKFQGSEQSLLSVIESTAKKGNVRKAIQQMVPSKDSGQVRVVLEDANFNHWVKWIDLLVNKYGVNVLDASVERNDDKANVVEVRMTFVR